MAIHFVQRIKVYDNNQNVVVTHSKSAFSEYDDAVYVMTNMVDSEYMVLEDENKSLLERTTDFGKSEIRYYDTDNDCWCAIHFRVISLECDRFDLD